MHRAHTAMALSPGDVRVHLMRAVKERWRRAGHVHKVDVEQLDELFVELTVFAAGIPPVLLQNRRQVPTLELAQAADKRARLMTAEAAHHRDWVISWVQKHIEAFEDNILRDGLPRASRLHTLAQVDAPRALVAEPCGEVLRQLVGQHANDCSQA